MTVDTFRPSSALARLALATAALTAVALLATTPLRQAHASAPAPHPGPQREPMPPTQTPPGEDAVTQLGKRIQSLRDEFHQQLDPLQSQVKALREKYDPQIKDLEGQRHDLIEQRKPADVQALDTQEDQALAALSDQEKAEVDRVHQAYAEKRKATQADFDARRKGLQTAKR